MAKGTLLNYSNLRGSIGGVTYSQNASGSYARVRKSPINRNTQGQQTARNNFASISGAFRTLTLAQRQTFEDMRDFYTTKDGIGNTVRPTASQLFARINGKLLQNGLIDITSLVTTCPAPVEVPNTQSSSPEVQISTSELVVRAGFGDGSTEVPADCLLIVSATPAISAGISRVPDGIFKKIGTLDAASDTVSTNVYNEYVNKFGVPSTSGNVWIEVKLFNKTTGQESNFVRSILEFL